jgi:hypothetical protein
MIIISKPCCYLPFPPWCLPHACCLTRGYHKINFAHQINHKQHKLKFNNGTFLVLVVPHNYNYRTPHIQVIVILELALLAYLEYMMNVDIDQM